jgi:hypothetical protein
VYADNVYKNLRGLKCRLSYQPAWDQHARMLERLAAAVPMAMVPGSEWTLLHCMLLLLIVT